MPLLHDLVHRPRRLFIRRALFQIHLWLGLLLSLYLILIALSGALLVYHDLLTRSTLPSNLSPLDPAHIASLPRVIENAKAYYKGAGVSSVTLPSAHIPVFQLNLTRGSEELRAIAEPQTGVVQPLPRSWVDVVYDFHLYLLLGSRHGMQWNGLGAIGLLVLALTGLLLWWRGLVGWTRGLRVSFRHHWRRINYDLHHALGIWTLLIVLWWALSGVYFAWYEPVVKLLAVVTPLSSEPEPLPVSLADAPATLQNILDAAQKVVPAGRLTIVYNPGLTPGHDVNVWMYLRSPEDFNHADIVRFDPRSASVRSVRHYGQNKTFGDWLLWLMQPLHFGNLWGGAMRALWCLLGVSLAVLTATGVLMYWNRFLRCRWLALQQPRVRAPAPQSALTMSDDIWR